MIGAYVAQELYGSAEKAYGETIKVNGFAFKVVGIVKQQEDTMDDRGTDDSLWMPYSCAVKMARNANINNYTFTIRELTRLTESKEVLEDYLYEQFKSEDLYTITDMSEMLEELNSMIAMVSAGLGGIAGISLLVAGVGVMNIMLVSVTERTRESGIRKTLGAKRSVIMQQFVIEAAVTTSAGGILGILLGSLATSVVGNMAGLSASPTPGGSYYFICRVREYRTFLRLYAGEPCGEAESNRCAAKRIRDMLLKIRTEQAFTICS